MLATVSTSQKLNEKKTGLSVKILLLVTQQCKIGHLGPCLKLYGTLVVGHFAKLSFVLCQVAKSTQTSPVCQIHITKLPTPCHQGYSANSSTPLQIVHYPNALKLLRYLSVIFGHNNNHNNNVQFSIILKTEAIVLETFIQIFGMTSIHFSEFLAIPKSNQLVANQPRYPCNKQRVL